MVMPRSLKEPVGLSPSYLRKTSKPPPASAARRGAGISGVLPSCSDDDRGAFRQPVEIGPVMLKDAGPAGRVGR